MESTRHREDRQSNSVPAVNPFFASLASAQARVRPQTPLQRFRHHLRKLSQLAEAGDVMGWNQFLPQLSKLALAAKIAPEKDLRTRVELKKMEMTLLLAAGKKAKTQGEDLKRRSEGCRAQDPRQAQEFSTKAEKLIALGEKLHSQLVAKTA